MATHSLSIDRPDGKRLEAVHNFLRAVPEKDAKEILTVMLHNGPGESRDGPDGIFLRIEAMLLHEGYDSLRFDYAAQGADFTFADACADLVTVYAWAQGQGYTHIVLITSGFAVVPALLSPHDSLAGLIALWPVFDPPLFYEDHLEELDKAREDNKDETLTYAGQTFGAAFLNELRMTDLTAELSACRVPVSILQGAKDERVSTAHLDLARAFLRAPRIEITLFEGGRHGLKTPKERENLLYHLLRFIEKTNA